MNIPAPYERTKTRRVEEAAALGITDRQYRRRLAAARAIARAIVPGVDDFPHVPIVDRPVPGLHYLLGAEACSRLPLGLMRIGSGRPAAVESTPSGHGPAGGPGPLQGRLRVRHFAEDLGERESEPKPPPRFRPKRPKRKKDRMR